MNDPDWSRCDEVVGIKRSGLPASLGSYKCEKTALASNVSDMILSLSRGWKHLLPRKRPGVIRRSSEVEREKAQRSTSAGEYVTARRVPVPSTEKRYRFSSDDFDVSSNGRPSGSGREKVRCYTSTFVVLR